MRRVVRRSGPLAGVQLRQSPGRMWIDFPHVFLIAYGPNAVARAVYAKTLLASPNYGWTDRTNALRQSVRYVGPTTVVYGDETAFYAPFVEAITGAGRLAYHYALEHFGYS